MKTLIYTEEDFKKQMELYEKFWGELKPKLNETLNKPIIVSTPIGIGQPLGELFYLDYEYPVVTRAVEAWNSMEIEIEDSKRIYSDIDPYGEEDWD